MKEIVGDINKIRKPSWQGRPPPRKKAAIDKVVAERKLVLEAVAKTWELKGAGDAVETQRFADEQLHPMVAHFTSGARQIHRLLNAAVRRVREGHGPAHSLGRDQAPRPRWSCFLRARCWPAGARSITRAPAANGGHRQRHRRRRP